MQVQKEISSERSPFKFKELKVYNSTEYLWDNLKKYRQVFDRDETAYVYAELSLYNKFFDVSDWTLKVNLKCFSVKGKKKTEVCDINLEKEVSRYDSVVYVREGWGNQKSGSFWKRGNYCWETYVDGVKIGSKFFYVIEQSSQFEDDFGEDGSPYLDLETLRLYEGPHDDTIKEDRKYLSAFNHKETRHIYLELEFRNTQPNHPWYLELFVKFYNHAKELKGQVNRLLEIKNGQETIELSVGWGTATPNLWRSDRYTAEVVFMDTLLATVPFTVEKENIEGPPLVYLPERDQPVILAPEQSDNESFETIMARFDELIGLGKIKQQVRNHAVYLRFIKLRKERGFKEEDEINVHSVFIGNPGTGKTTVATMMGKLYKKMGLLSKGHVYVADRVDLVGEYIGQTAPKTREVIEKARGGVLFIDEAYSLARANDDGKDFGREVIEILVKEMSNGPGDLAVIVAGYPDEMKRFLESNPGLRSRFKHHYEFRDFLPQELSVIAEYSCTRKDVNLSLDARSLIDEMIIKAFRERNRTFGNARFVGDLIEKAKIQMGLRLMKNEDRRGKLTNEDLSTIELEDVQALAQNLKPDRPAIPVDEDLLRETLQELDGLIGMTNVKSQLKDLINLVRFYRQMSQDVLNAFHLHTVLIGNPGTGKTTIARIIAQLYKALGILERGHLVETDRQGLIAGYVGQTADKTAKKIKEAEGGVLFIDEAYALTQKNSGRQGDFGDEVIQTLLKRMEDQRGEFFVFVAGYPEPMDDFLKANPGLSSRFDKILRFEDYSASELLEIADLMFSQAKKKITPAARKKLASYLEFVYNYRDQFFGNARTVRQLVTEINRRHDLRRATMDFAAAKKQEKIGVADLAHLIEDPNTLVIQRKRIGFGG